MQLTAASHGINDIDFAYDYSYEFQLTHDRLSRLFPQVIYLPTIKQWKFIFSLYYIAAAWNAVLYKII